MKKISELFPEVSCGRRRELLTLPCRGKADAVLDTDTFNEIDDQFALAFAVLSPEVLNLKAVLLLELEKAIQHNALIRLWKRIKNTTIKCRRIRPLKDTNIILPIHLEGSSIQKRLRHLLI